jgi:thiol-disulfide isomerase/thioredoxin
MISRRRLSIAVAAVSAALAAFGAGLFVGRAQLDGEGGGQIGRDASPLFAVGLPDATGAQQLIGQWRGKVVLVNFWATWCVPCRAEMPEFVVVQRELGERGLQIVGVAIDAQEKVVPFIDELKINYPTLIGGYGAMELSKSFGNTLMALPFSIVIDRTGRIAHVQLGQLSGERVRSLTAKLL